MTNQCQFCSQNIEVIDYKDVPLLRRFVSSQAKITKTKYTHTCARHQRALTTAIKRARYMAILPFVRR